MRAEATARQDYAGRATRMVDLLLEVMPTIDGMAGHAPGHAVRTSYLAMRLAEAVGIGDRDRIGIFYAGLLHDAGSIADGDPASGRPAMMRRLMPLPRGIEEERRAAEHTRVRRGAQFAARAGFGPEVAITVLALHERWDGRGLPMGLAGESIPLFARIVSLADGLDLGLSRDGHQGAVTTLHARGGSWYDPQMVSVLLALCSNGLLQELDADDLPAALRELEPTWLMRFAAASDADRIQNALMLAGAA